VNVGFTWRLAWREGRASYKRLGVYMASITLGVGALVAIHSFQRDIERALDGESQTLLGADVRISSNRPLSEELDPVLDSLLRSGAGVARTIAVASMVMDLRSDRVRLAQVMGFEPGYPFYGPLETDPPGIWGRIHEGRVAIVDPAVLIQLGAEVGDSLRIGTSSFVLAGTVTGLPTELGLQTAIGPRVYVGFPRLAEAGLLAFGTVARHRVNLRLPEREDQDALWTDHEDLFQSVQVSYTTAQAQAQDLTFAVGSLSRFLGLVGLAALLLGGIGVGSAIHVYVKDKLVTVAILRCLGAKQRSVFNAYLIQSAVMGFWGSLLGAGLGVAIQFVLPGLLAGVLPVAVVPRISWAAVAGGLAIGVWVSLIFAIGPMLNIRGVPPLLALRSDVEPVRRRDPWRWIVSAALILTLAGLSIVEAPGIAAGLAFAGGLIATGLLLWATAAALMRATRRFLPASASYHVRQGVSNLFRPQNQTVAVTLALGFGAFVVGTVLQVEGNLARQFTLEQVEGRPNVLLFDVQVDQAPGVEELLSQASSGMIEVTPLVPGRLTAINGEDVETLAARPPDERPDRWALRREYRHTYRAELSASEELVKGTWWSETSEVRRTGSGAPPVSIESDLAGSLKVGVGDRLTWNIGGAEMETEIASVRTVDWARFETNFFFVFEPGSLDRAPQTAVMLARIESEDQRAQFQRELVDAFPNVSVLDLSNLQNALDTILSRVSQAIRFLGGFSIVAGLIVLAGALATSRYQRLREGALLKTLGARRRLIVKILLAEYLALGTLASATGLALALGAGWLLIDGLFEFEFEPLVIRLFVAWTVVVALTVCMGLLGSRGVLGRRPLEVLRDAGG
jgi:putative ABC transport system permease protein